MIQNAQKNLKTNIIFKKRMKRLLLPLLAALALPIAVSANFIYLDYVSNDYQNKHLLISYGGGKSQEEK